MSPQWVGVLAWRKVKPSAKPSYEESTPEVQMKYKGLGLFYFRVFI